MEQRTALLDIDSGRRIAEEQLTRAVMSVLHQTAHRNVEQFANLGHTFFANRTLQMLHEILVKHIGKSLLDDTHLTYATIGKDEIGHFAALLDKATIATHHHLVHRRIIVGTNDTANIEFAIFLLLRLAVHKDDAARHGVGTRDVGVIERLDMSRQTGQAELLLNLGEQACLPLFGIELLLLFELVNAILPAVLLGQFEELALIAALGYERHAAIGQNAGLKRNDEFGRT